MKRPIFLSASTEEAGFGYGLLTEHPEGKLRLLDDSPLTCYPGSSPRGEELSAEDQDDLQMLFLRSVPFLWKHRERILSDSRMFLSLIPLRSGLMYMGHLPYPTLGMYLELWGICDAAHYKDAEGVEQFVCRVAGSPLSGANRCTCVDASGVQSRLSISRFSEVWQCFANIIGRYSDVRYEYKSYDLREVIERLSREEFKRQKGRSGVVRVELEAAARYDRVRLGRQCEVLEHRLKYAEEQKSLAIKLYRELTLEKYRTELEQLYAEYEEQGRAWKRREVELADERRAIRRQLREDPTRNRELQPRLKLLRKEEEAWRHRLGGEFDDRLRAYFVHFPITMHDLGGLLHP